MMTRRVIGKAMNRVMVEQSCSRCGRDLAYFLEMLDDIKCPHCGYLQEYRW